MTRRYLHPTNGRHRRNAGVDEQIFLYPVTIYSHPVSFKKSNEREFRKLSLDFDVICE